MVKSKNVLCGLLMVFKGVKKASTVDETADLERQRSSDMSKEPRVDSGFVKRDT